MISVLQGRNNNRDLQGNGLYVVKIDALLILLEFDW
jgi:hypothetical protein